MQIFRTHDIEGDAWAEQALIFPDDKELSEVFTKDNIRKLFDDVSVEEYPDIVINIFSKSYVEVTISHLRMGDVYGEFNFRKMDSCLIIE